MNIFNRIIKDGSLSFRSRIPKSILDYYSSSNDFVIMKISNLSENDLDLNIFDNILISFNKEIINQLDLIKNIGNPSNFEASKFVTEDTKSNTRIYLPKKKFSLLRSKSQTKIYLPVKNSSEELVLNLPEEIYEKFLRIEFYSSKRIRILKEKITKGTSKFYGKLETFLRSVKSKKIICNSHEMAEIRNFVKNINLDNVDFSNLRIRNRFLVDVSVVIFDNAYILIAHPKNEINFKAITDIIDYEINLIYLRGLTLYHDQFNSDIESNIISVITGEDHRILKNHLKKIRILGQELFSLDFIRDLLINFAVLKKKQGLLEKRLPILQHKDFADFTYYLSMYHTFTSHFPTNKLATNQMHFFQLFIPGKSEITLKKYIENINLLIKFSKDLIYLFLVAREFNLLKNMFKDRFSVKYKRKIDIIFHNMFSFSKNIFNLVGMPFPEILASSVFSIFILSLRLDSRISISSIVDILGIYTYSNNRCIKKILSISKNQESPEQWKFTDFKITDKNTKNQLNKSIIKFLFTLYLKNVTSGKFSIESLKVLEEFRIRLELLILLPSDLTIIGKPDLALLNRMVNDLELKSNKQSILKVRILYLLGKLEKQIFD